LCVYDKTHLTTKPIRKLLSRRYLLATIAAMQVNREVSKFLAN